MMMSRGTGLANSIRFAAVCLSDPVRLEVGPTGSWLPATGGPSRGSFWQDTVSLGLKGPDQTMSAKALSFQAGDNVVYPKHGVGRVIEIQSSEIAGTRLELYVLRFDKERMTLKVPTNKAESVGMRKLSSEATLKDALLTLRGKPRIKRIMWSRRAQEYEAKINSGDLVCIAEVVRDLHRAEDQPEQSYSERQIFEAAISRLAREVAAMKNIDEPAAQREIEDVLKAA